LNPNQANTLDQLRAENPKFADIKAVREGNVYNCTARSTPEGGSDFWESGTLRADRVLADLIAIFHPDKAPDDGGYYFLRLR
ncbi:MAG: ABC transporter substrate-binding protein, partial [Tidjanibacter sp.]|nr:ABC transporter substrate-binding protein [Tidjanibacter sp.]